MTTLLVAVGGLLGVLIRFGIGRLTIHHEQLLWSTVGINLAGSFLLGCWREAIGSAATCARESGWASWEA